MNIMPSLVRAQTIKIIRDNDSRTTEPAKLVVTINTPIGSSHSINTIQDFETRQETLVRRSHDDLQVSVIEISQPKLNKGAQLKFNTNLFQVSCKPSARLSTRLSSVFEFKK